MGPDLVLQKTLVPTAAIGQYRAVVQTGNESCTQAGTLGAYTPGICQDEITADDVADGGRGRAAAIRIMGISRAVAGAALAVGDPVTTAADGRVVVATAGNYVLGRCVTPVSAADDWTAVFLTHEGTF